MRRCRRDEGGTSLSESLIIRNCIAADARGARDDYCDLLVHDGRIAEITAAGAAREADARVLDTAGGTVVPGLVNMHEHLSFAHPHSSESAAIEGESPLDRVLRMAGSARRGVGAGVTTMRIVGEFEGFEQAVRNAIRRGHLTGPRLFTAGAPLTYSGGHGASVGALEGGSAELCRRLAQNEVAAGVDLLKLMISSGIAGGNVEQVRMSFEEFDAIRSVARASGLRMAVHTAAVEHPIVEALVDDGVDTLEHCYTAPDAILDRCVSRGMLLVLTPLVTQHEGYFRAIGLPDHMIAEITAESDRHWGVVRTAVAKGARIALGTDFHSHLELEGTWAVVRELELYAEAGVTGRDLLALASRTGAEWLGIADAVGLVEEGYIADVLVLDGLWRLVVRQGYCRDVRRRCPGRARGRRGRGRRRARDGLAAAVAGAAGGAAVGGRARRPADGAAVRATIGTWLTRSSSSRRSPSSVGATAPASSRRSSLSQPSSTGSTASTRSSTPSSPSSASRPGPRPPTPSGGSTRAATCRRCSGSRSR